MRRDRRGRCIDSPFARSTYVGDERGFTLLEISVVLFIMGLMLTIAMPYLGGFRTAKLRSEARRLAGRATYLFDEASGNRVVLRLMFDLDHGRYAVARLDPYALNPTFMADNSPGATAVVLPPDIRIRDVSVEGVGTLARGHAECQFYPQGYVDATVVHLQDASGHVMTLAFAPLTGRVNIATGDVSAAEMFR
jgi:general secretion pathway protein H